MTPAILTLDALEIPFKAAFKHAGAERARTQSVLVRAAADDGTMGWGEGCPREYVTRESVATCRDFFARHREAWLRLDAPESVAAWADAHAADLDANPAAWCAVEMALLDFFGRLGGRSVESLLGVPGLSGPFAYTAVLGDSAPETFRAQLRRFAALGFADFKVKVSGEPARDLDKLAALRELAPPGFRLRLDANNLWPDAPAALRALEALQEAGAAPFAVEEPLPAFAYAGLEAVARGAGVRIVLDESALNLSHLDAVAGREDLFILNLRVSKMGGLRRSLALVAAARRRKLPVIVGAQVGETSLLTRAALTVAEAARDILLAQEGAYGTHLLEADLTDRPLMFGQGGQLDPAKGLDPALGGLQIACRMP